MLLVTVAAVLLHIVGANKFGYDLNNGPSTWKGICQTGKRQSPIDIRAFEIEFASLAPLSFINYERTGDIVLANNGHTVIGTGFEKWGEKRPYISGGNLNGTYYLSQFHFHWSQQNNTGSEHTIASLHYPAELHLVHIKKNPVEDEVNTIAVVGAFIRLDDHADSLQNLKPHVLSIKMPETESMIPDFSANSLLPVRKENFYRYEGSLTTPGCDEAVVWTLMADPISATPSQMQAFQQVHFASGKIGHNWRPTQPLNGRKILFRPTIIRRSTDTMQSIGTAVKPVFSVLIIISFMKPIICLLSVN
uniref:Carbonic anhydrase n=1 Tax=Setaria digitata TaxID=48799 RepID=A0A915PEL0_9BILA